MSLICTNTVSAISCGPLLATRQQRLQHVKQCHCFVSDTGQYLSRPPSAGGLRSRQQCLEALVHMHLHVFISPNRCPKLCCVKQQAKNSRHFRFRSKDECQTKFQMSSFIFMLFTSRCVEQLRTENLLFESTHFSIEQMYWDGHE